jgi:hypothetical protein
MNATAINSPTNSIKVVIRIGLALPFQWEAF